MVPKSHLSKSQGRCCSDTFKLQYSLDVDPKPENSRIPNWRFDQKVLHMR